MHLLEIIKILYKYKTIIPSKCRAGCGDSRSLSSQNLPLSKQLRGPGAPVPRQSLGSAPPGPTPPRPVLPVPAPPPASSRPRPELCSLTSGAQRGRGSEVVRGRGRGRETRTAAHATRRPGRGPGPGEGLLTGTLAKSKQSLQRNRSRWTRVSF